MKKFITLFVSILFLINAKGQTFEGSFTPGTMPVNPGTTLTVTFTSTGPLTSGLKIFVSNPPAANAILPTTEIFGGFSYTGTFVVPANQPSPSNIFFIIGNAAGTVFFAKISTLQVLPISFLQSSAKYVAAEKSITLNWTIASVDDVKEFNVLRSTDGRNFSSIATVKPTVSLNYTYKDLLNAANAETVSYYRIVGVSLQNNIKQTATMIVKKSNFKFNPVILNNGNVTNELIVTGLNLTEYKVGEIKIFDVTGRYYPFVIQNNNSIALKQLSKGIYYLKIANLPTLRFMEN